MMLKMTEDEPGAEGPWSLPEPAWKLVPVQPDGNMAGELARDIVMWWSFSPPTGNALHRHLKRLGREIPAWLPELIADRMYVPPKGAVAIAIYRAMLDAAPAAPQQAGTFDHLAGRGMHELRFDELTPYVLSILAGKWQDTPDVRIALDWIVSELKRKTNDERALAVKLDAIKAAPVQQAEPVSEFQRSAPERIWLNVGDINDEDRFEDVSNDGCEWICWCEDSQDKNDVPYVRADLAHPPPAEVQRLEAASRKVLQIVDDIGRRAFTLSGWMDISELRAALDALEGK